MATYSLTCRIVVSAYTEVVADSLEEAIEISHSRSVHMDLNGYEASDVWIVEDFDGLPQGIEEV